VSRKAGFLSIVLPVLELTKANVGRHSQGPHLATSESAPYHVYLKHLEPFPHTFPNGCLGCGHCSSDGKLAVRNTVVSEAGKCRIKVRHYGSEQALCENASWVLQFQLDRNFHGLESTRSDTSYIPTPQEKCVLINSQMPGLGHQRGPEMLQEKRQLVSELHQHSFLLTLPLNITFNPGHYTEFNPICVFICLNNLHLIGARQGGM
ncbi:hypothetical protein STEG23_003620, partial [Scotinomys teguina]